MGRTLLILLAGFAASFGVLAMSKNQRLVSSVGQMVEQLGDYEAKNTASSGAYLALNQLYQNPAWRGTNNFVIGANMLAVTVKNDSLGGAPLPHRVRIVANAGNAEASGLTQVVIFDRGFQEFAIWAKDTVINAITYDSLGVANSDLLVKNAPFMPKINKDSLFAVASVQGHLENEDMNGHYHPDNGFPNGSFYYDSTAVSQTANVIHVGGNLHIRDDRTVYGIFIVEGHVLLDVNTKLQGVIYLPNPSSRVYNNDPANSQVVGGIVTWGEVDGNGYQIIVRHHPQYMRALASKYAPNNPPLRVLTWK
jgi:hypothetical protein